LGDCNKPNAERVDFRKGLFQNPMQNY